MTVVSRRLSGCACLLAACLELIRCAIAPVGPPGFQEPFGDVPVDVEPLRLPVRPKTTAYLRAFVPVEPQPSQRVQQLDVRLLGIALRVGVLYSEHKSPFVVPCERPVEQRRSGHSHVWVASR